MRKLAVLVLNLVVGLLLLSQHFSAQAVPSRTATIQEMRDKQAEEQRMDNNSVLSNNRGGRKKLDLGIKEEKAEAAKKLEAIEELNKKVSAPPAYYDRYSAFLKNKNTGLARLFPDQGCSQGKVVSVQELEKCGIFSEIPGTGSSYSFRLSKIPADTPLDYILGLISISDIRFTGGNFVVGTDRTQDIISSIGEIDLEDITLKSESVKFLKDYKTVSTLTKLKSQNVILTKGVNANGYLYSRIVPVKLQITYILRSIAYSPESYKTFWNTDQIAAFKVVGQEADGSVILLWKILKEKSAPALSDK